jgi:hypothetical protein
MKIVIVNFYADTTGDSGGVLDNDLGLEYKKRIH